MTIKPWLRSKEKQEQASWEFRHWLKPQTKQSRKTVCRKLRQQRQWAMFRKTDVYANGRRELRREVHWYELRQVTKHFIAMLRFRWKGLRGHWTIIGPSQHYPTGGPI